MSGAALLALCTDNLIARFGQSEFETEMRAAKEEYTERRGRVFEEDEQWERFTRGLLEWYVVERSWRDTGLVPAHIVLRETATSPRRYDACDESEVLALAQLASSQRCVAEILSLSKGRIHILDLVGGAEFVVREERSLAGLCRGDVVELRLIGLNDSVLLGRTFLFHPANTAPAIAKLSAQMRGSGASRGDVIDRMARLRSRCQSYQHVSSIRIYESNGELAQR